LSNSASGSGAAPPHPEIVAAIKPANAIDDKVLRCFTDEWRIFDVFI
jgi:hypothetical protein